MLGLVRIIGVEPRLSDYHGLPNLRNPISSSIILPLNLPPELRWDSWIALGLHGDSGLCYIVLVSDLLLGNGRKHWRGDVMELLGLPTIAQVCTMLTHEPCGVAPLSGHRCILNR